MNEFLIIFSLAITLSVPGIAALWLHWQNERKQPDALKTMAGTVAYLSEQVRELQQNRTTDHAMIIRLSRRVELWKEYAKLQALLLEQAGVKNVPQPPRDDDDTELPMILSKVRVKRQLADHFTIAEIDDLAFRLGIDREELSGTTKVQRATALVEAAEDRDILGRLIEIARSERPNVNWRD